MPLPLCCLHSTVAVRRCQLDTFHPSHARNPQAHIRHAQGFPSGIRQGCLNEGRVRVKAKLEVTVMVTITLTVTVTVTCINTTPHGSIVTVTAAQ